MFSFYSLYKQQSRFVPSAKTGLAKDHLETANTKDDATINLEFELLR